MHWQILFLPYPQRYSQGKDRIAVYLRASIYLIFQLKMLLTTSITLFDNQQKTHGHY